MVTRKPGLSTHTEPLAALAGDIRRLIEEARSHVATMANATLTLLYCRIGERIRSEVLGEQRASYGAQIVVSLSRQLSADQGPSFGEIEGDATRDWRADQIHITHMYRYKNIVQHLLQTVSQGIPANFSGFGLVFYRGDGTDLPVVALCTDAKLAGPMNDEEIVELLLAISRYDDVRHDGFHFINESHGLTHLSQFFAPPIPVMFEPKRFGVGARHRAAELGSLLKSITAVVVVGREGRVSLFKDGRVMEVKYET